MATGNFERCLAETLSHEGGYVDHPKDPGGATMKGVTLATFRRRRPGATKAELRAISDADLAAIYREDYWRPVGGDGLAPGVDLATFDYGVHSGPGTARKNLAAVLGGPDDETVRRLCARRLSIYRGFKHWETFGKGWTRRVAAVEAKGVAWAVAAVAGAGAARAVLERDAKQAAKAEARNATGAAGSGAGAGSAGGAAAMPDVGSAEIALLVILLVLGGVAALILWRRSRIEAARARAFAAVAQEV